MITFLRNLNKVYLSPAPQAVPQEAATLILLPSPEPQAVPQEAATCIFTCFFAINKFFSIIVKIKKLCNTGLIVTSHKPPFLISL